MTDITKDHDYIWLEPPSTRSSSPRGWCEEDVWNGGTKYIRADLHEARCAEAMQHLGMVLYATAGLPDYERCQAMDDALAYYNEARPEAKVELRIDAAQYTDLLRDAAQYREILRVVHTFYSTDRETFVIELPARLLINAEIEREEKQLTDTENPERGWYVFTHEQSGAMDCLLRTITGKWMCANDFVEPPPDWTLGPRIDHLLRDRETLHECFIASGIYPETDEQIETIALEWVRKYHEYKRDAARLDWLLKTPSGSIALLWSRSVADKRALIDAEIAKYKTTP